MKLVFFGTPDFAVPTLNYLHESPHDVLGVVTSPDNRSGRGLEVQSSSMKKKAELFERRTLQIQSMIWACWPNVKNNKTATEPDISHYKKNVNNGEIF